MKDRIIKDVRNLSEHEDEENYYKPERVNLDCESELDVKVKVIGTK